MSRYMTPSFWDGAAERAIKTGAQTALATIGAAAYFGAVDWLMVASATGMAAVLSVLMSLADPDRVDTAIATYQHKR